MKCKPIRYRQTFTALQHQRSGIAIDQHFVTTFLKILRRSSGSQFWLFANLHIGELRYGLLNLVHRLDAKPDQIKAVIQEYAQSYEKPDEVVRWYYQQPERLRDVESIVVEGNVVQWALSNARVEDKPTAFDDLMGNAQ